MIVEDEDDWTTKIEIGPTTPELKQRAHDLFDPIWQSGMVSRGLAYHLLAAALEVPERQAHFKRMPRHRLLQAIRILPALRDRIARSVLSQHPRSGTPEADSGAQRQP